ncbi:MAG: response regulator [Rubripirellula sp.]
MLVVPNLLVTDDDSAFRQVVCEGLTRRGFRVTQACDGREAIDVINDSEVHLALIDVHMPRVTGLEVIQHLNAQPKSPTCLLMSAELDDEIRREAKRMRAYDVLSKPIRLGELTTIICAALTEIYGWRPPAAPTSSQSS